MHLRVNLKFLGAILVHPVRRQNFAGTGAPQILQHLRLCHTCTIAISLKRHMLTHSGEKPFSFNERDYKCTQASDLKTHRFTHTGKKLFLPANSLIIPPHNLVICRVESAEGATCAAIQGQLGSPVNQH